MGRTRTSIRWTGDKTTFDVTGQSGDLHPPDMTIRTSGGSGGDRLAVVSDPDGDWRVQVALVPAQERAYSRQQLAQAEWLDHVIVRAKLQPRDPVRLVLQRREDDDRNRALRRQRPADRKAIDPWEHQVEQDEVRLKLPCQRQPRASIERHRNREAGLLQVVTE